MTPATVLHHAALAAAVGALVAAGLRVASLCVPRGLERALAAIVLAAAAAVAEALALGLVAAGGDSAALLAAAVVTWAVARRVAPAPAVAPTDELRQWWETLRRPHALVLAAAAGAWAAWTVWMLANPALGHDMVAYHLPEAVSWVHDGRPGSIVTVVAPLPVGNYPLTHEVLLAWGLAVGRSFVWATLVTAAVPALTAAATWSGLRRLGVERPPAALGAAALVATPAVIASQSGGASLDPAALAWLVTCGALVVAATTQPAALVPALIAGGLAIGTKTTTLPLAVLALAAGGFHLRRRLRGVAPPLSVAAVLALVVGGSWYARNLVTHGSPFWPFQSTPWGDPRPALIDRVDARFLDDPSETLSRLGSYYWEHFGGPLILLAGALVVAVLARTRTLMAAALVTAASVLLWMDAPFTGVLATRALDAGTGDTTRYMLPAVAAATLTIALASRATRLRPMAAAILAAAAAVGLYETLDLGFPSAPPPWVPLAGAALGATAVTALAAVRPRPVPFVATAALAVALAGVGGAVAADGYVERHATTGTIGAGVAGWMARQPAWRDGSAPVASTFSELAPLAGDRLQHPLSLVEPRDACRPGLARRSWRVLSLLAQAAARTRPCARPSYADDDYWAYPPRGRSRVP